MKIIKALFCVCGIYIVYKAITLLIEYIDSRFITKYIKTDDITY